MSGPSIGPSPAAAVRSRPCESLGRTVSDCGQPDSGSWARLPGHLEGPAQPLLAAWRPRRTWTGRDAGSASL